MISRAASVAGTEVSVDRVTFTMFHEELLVNEQEVHHKLRFRFLGVVALALFCDYLLLTLCVPVLPALLGDEYSALEIGLVFASKPFFQFLANPYMGEIVDKSGPKNPLLIGVIVLALSTFLFAYGLSFDENLSIAYPVVMVARSVQGIASASTMSAGMTLSALTHHESNRGTAMGIAMIGVAFGTLAGPPLGGIMGYFLPLWSPYVLVGGLLVFNALAQLYVLHRKDTSIPVYIKDPKEKTIASRMSITDFRATDSSTTVEAHNGQPQQPGAENESVGLLKLLKQPEIFFTVLIAVIGNCTIGMIEPLVPLYLHDTFHQNILQQGLIFATTTVTYLVCTPVAGVLSDSYPKWACFSVGLFGLSLGLGLLYASTTVARVCIALLFVGGGMSFIDTPALPLLSEIIERKELFAAGMVYALSDMALCVGFTIGPIVGPLLQQAYGNGTNGFRATALSMSVLCAVILPVTYLVLRHHRGVHTGDNSEVKEPLLTRTTESR